MHALRKFRNLFLIVGLVAIVAGYVFLGYGSISLPRCSSSSGYCVLVPMALL